MRCCHRPLITVVAAAAALLMTSGPAYAQASTCSISTTAVVFGTYNVFSSSPSDSVGSVTYRCRNTLYISISLTRGQSSTFSPRQMSSSGEKLSYNLFRDAARTSIWGDLTGGTAIHFDLLPAHNEQVSVPIYGRIPAGQDVRAGSYSDTITVVVNY